MQRLFSFFVSGLCAAVAPPALAEIYKCVDPGGHVTYSNVVQKGCAKLDLEPLSTIPGPRRVAPPPAAPAPQAFPKVEPEAQKRRDADRRKIIEEELATEERSLDAARKELAEQEAVRLGDERNYQKYLDRVQGYKDRVELHERNVAALRRELGNLK